MLIYRMLKKMKNPLCGYKRNVSGPILCTSSQKTHIHTHRTKDLITGHSNTNVKLALAANISAGALDFAVLRVFKWRMNSSEFKLKMLLYPYMRVIKHIHVTKAQIKVQNHLNLIYIYLEKAMPIRSSILAWRFPGTEEPGGLLMECITLINLQILKNPCIPGIKPIWSWCMIFLM